MKPITTIHLAQRLITIEDEALLVLKDYLTTLKTFFATEESGDEIYSDIENRVAEIMDKKLKSGSVCITTVDVNEVINIVGTPQELGIHTKDIPNNTNDHASAKKDNPTPKKLTRNANDNVFSGLASGLANYFNIDPIWMRLIFVLGFFAGGIGFFAYVILSFIIPSSNHILFTNKRMFRDPDDKMIAGVCSGLANYLHTTAINTRLLFVAPLGLVIISEIVRDNFSFFNIHHSIEGFIPLSFLSYIVLWLIMPKAISTAEKLQMKGEDINVNTIRNEVNGSGINTTVLPQHSNGCGQTIWVLFKAFAYFVIGCIAFGLLMGMFGVFTGGVALLPFASYIFTAGNQLLLAQLAWVLFFALPIVAVVTLIIRRIIGYKELPKYIINSLVGAWLIGLVSLLFLVTIFVQEFKVKGNAQIVDSTINSNNSLLYVQLADSTQPAKTFVSYNYLHTNGFEIINDQLLIKNIDLQVYKSVDSNYHLQIIKEARGEDNTATNKRLETISFVPIVRNNTIYLPNGFFIAKGDVFRGQGVVCKIFVPQGKQIHIDKKVEDNFEHININVNDGNFNFNNNNFPNYTSELGWESGKDLTLIHNELQSKEDQEEANQDRLDSIKDSKEEALDDKKDSIDNVKEKLIDSIEKSK